jgi:HSP20 family molecular chaperone IbpA
MVRSTNLREDIFSFHRDADHPMQKLWSERSTHAMPSAPRYPLRVQTDSDRWRLEIPMPGIDPNNVSIEVAGTTISVRAEHAGDPYDAEARYDQTLSLPQFLDVDRITAAHRHGLLHLTVPLKDSVKPRRIQIDGIEADQKQLTTA